MPRRAKQLRSVLIKPAGPDCNLACAYCFYLEKARLFPERNVHRMSRETLEATVRGTMTAGSPVVTFGWQGGEPTLMGVEFFEQAIEFEKRYGGDGRHGDGHDGDGRYGRAGRTVGNGLQTNGLLIDGAWCGLLRDAKFLVGLSLDGPRHVHDRYRQQRGGEPTWQRVVDAGKRMLDAGVEVNALAVVNDYSAEFAGEIYEFLKEQRLTYMQFIPCLEPDPREPGRPAAFSVAPERFGRFLCEAFDRWIADFRDGRPTTSIRWFESIFATYVNAPPPECTLLAECGNYLVIEHNGDVFACDFFVEEAWRLGNVLGDDLGELLNSPRQAEFGRRKAILPRDCQTCEWLSHCRGGCPKERWGGPADARQSYFCPAYKMFFAHADAKLRELAAGWLAGRNAPSPLPAPPAASGPASRPAVAGRNEPCPCGSGAKYKRCCGR
jgi:uncharacterized protein